MLNTFVFVLMMAPNSHYAAADGQAVWTFDDPIVCQNMATNFNENPYGTLFWCRVAETEEN
jgi:hypothetical protein